MSNISSELTLELKRKAFHCLALIYLAVYARLGHPLTLYLAVPWTALVVLLETARLKCDWARDAARKIFGGMMRAKETDRYTGAFYTSLGTLATFLFFGSRPQIAKAAILYLALGDAASAVVGKTWGRHSFKVWGSTRSVEGTAAGFITALSCGLAVQLSPAMALVGALAFTLTDVFPLPPDDNLWIPVITGSVLAAI